jgi:hypothetical protein
MKYKNILFIGIFTCMIGAAFINILIHYSITNKQLVGSKSIIGFIIIIFGAYIIYIGKKKQKKENESNTMQK